MSSTNQLVCLKRPEPSLSTVFEDMYLNERLVDVTLSCSDGQLQAHKLVLAASSPYFSGLFEKLANPFHYPVIIIKDMRIADLRMIIDFIYRGQITTTQDRLLALIKSAESLQINGLSNSTSSHAIISSNAIDIRETLGNSGLNRSTNNTTKAKKTKKGPNSSTSSSSSALGLTTNQPGSVYTNRAYQSSRQDESSPQPEKLLEQSMITGDSIDESLSGHHQFSYSHTDPTSTRNLNEHQLHSSSNLQVQQLPNLDQHHHNQQQPQHQLNNQLQVLSHSLTANRTSFIHSSINGQSSVVQLGQQHSRGRVHSCNICWKSFREKANLKRHLQVHSIDRVIYSCPDCNKTFSWKDNYIRHTKTPHHINNVRSHS